MTASYEIERARLTNIADLLHAISVQQERDPEFERKLECNILAHELAIITDVTARQEADDVAKWKAFETKNGRL